MKMIIYYKNKRIKIPVKKVSRFGKIIGLMFKKKTTKNLFFDFKKKTKMRIHSYFVFFNFFVIWTDEKSKVLEWRLVKPFTFGIKPKNYFVKLIEIPINKKNEEIVKFFVGGGKI